MKQYLNLMQDVLKNGIVKEDRTGTGTRSVFGRQLRFNLQEGFPLVTTKKLHLKSIIHELIWFLAGDTNIEYLKQNGVSIWDEWADENGNLGPIYGYQWRWWPGRVIAVSDSHTEFEVRNGENWTTINEPALIERESIDQIKDVINQLKTNPDSRRMIVSAWNVADIPKMKLPPCHALFQFYTHELTLGERSHLYAAKVGSYAHLDQTSADEWETLFEAEGIPARYLDCQLYQRSH